MNRRPFFVIGAVLVAIVAIIVYCRRDIDQNRRAVAPIENADTGAVERLPSAGDFNRGSADPSSIEVGGVRRPETDLVAGDQGEQAVGNAETDGFDYGRTPPVKPDANIQVAAVVRSIREQRNFEQVSTLIAPPKFDPQAYQQDPQAYIDRVEPGRVFQVLQPGADTPALRKVGPMYQEIQQGESVYLQVTAPEGAPVTFTSLDLGMFENQLTSITVKADADGLARASFVGTTGTIDDVDILAGSPVTSGNVRFIVHVVN